MRSGRRQRKRSYEPNLRRGDPPGRPHRRWQMRRARGFEPRMQLRLRRRPAVDIHRVPRAGTSRPVRQLARRRVGGPACWLREPHLPQLRRQRVLGRDESRTQSEAAQPLLQQFRGRLAGFLVPARRLGELDFRCFEWDFGVLLK